MKRKQNSQDPSTVLLASLGLIRNPGNESYVVPGPTGVLPGSKKEDLLSTVHPPSYFPCVVLRLAPGQYCYFPIYVSVGKGDIGVESQIDDEKYRELVIPASLANDKAFVEAAMLKLTQLESLYHNCDACLCMGPSKAYYFDMAKDEFHPSTQVPTNNNWLSAKSYMSFDVYKSNSKGKVIRIPMNKSLNRIHTIPDNDL